MSRTFLPALVLAWSLLPALARAQVHIDVPASNATVGADFQVGGWAVDFRGGSGGGADVVHVYGYPASGAPPVFAGWALVNVARPDLEAAFGSRYGNSGYSLIGHLPNGSYMLVVFAHSTYSGNFDYVATANVNVVDPSAEPASRNIPAFGYGRVEQAMPASSAPGQTGQWWCDAHFGGNLGGSWQCLSVSGGNSCSAQVPANELVSCRLVGTGGGVDETPFQPDNPNCDRTRAIVGSDPNKQMLLDWCAFTNYRSTRLAETVYLYNDYVRIGANRRYGGMIFELYGTDKVNRIQEHGGSGMQMSIWGYDDNPTGSGFFRTVACDPNPYPFTGEGAAACKAANNNQDCAGRLLGAHVSNCTTEVACAWSAGDPWNPIQAGCGPDEGLRVSSVSGTMNAGGAKVTLTKVDPYNFTKNSRLTGLTWSQTTGLDGNKPYARVRYVVDYTNSGRPMGFHGQEVPAIFLGDGDWRYFYFYGGSAPYQNSSAAITKLWDPSQYKSIRLPGRAADDCPNGNCGSAFNYATEDWMSVCDATETRCFTVAIFSPLARQLAVRGGPNHEYVGAGSWFKLGVSSHLEWEVFVFPYRYNDVIEGKTVRQYIYELR